jgi:hypothetical protein
VLTPNADRVADAIANTLTSPAEIDTNLEPANVVDGLFAIARAIDNLAAAVRTTSEDRDE